MTTIYCDRDHAALGRRPFNFGTIDQLKPAVRVVHLAGDRVVGESGPGTRIHFEFPCPYCKYAESFREERLRHVLPMLASAGVVRISLVGLRSACRKVGRP